MRVNPTMKLVKPKWWNGLNHCALGVRCPAGAFPVPTLAKATIEKITRTVTSIPRRTFCMLAEISTPT